MRVKRIILVFIICFMITGCTDKTENTGQVEAESKDALTEASTGELFDMYKNDIVNLINEETKGEFYNTDIDIEDMISKINVIVDKYESELSKRNNYEKSRIYARVCINNYLYTLKNDNKSVVSALREDFPVVAFDKEIVTEDVFEDESIGDFSRFESVDNDDKVDNAYNDEGSTVDEEKTIINNAKSSCIKSIYCIYKFSFDYHVLNDNETISYDTYEKLKLFGETENGHTYIKARIKLYFDEQYLDFYNNYEMIDLSGHSFSGRYYLTEPTLAGQGDDYLIYDFYLGCDENSKLTTGYIYIEEILNDEPEITKLSKWTFVQAEFEGDESYLRQRYDPERITLIPTYYCGELMDTDQWMEIYDFALWFDENPFSEEEEAVVCIQFKTLLELGYDYDITIKAYRDDGYYLCQSIELDDLGTCKYSFPIQYLYLRYYDYNKGEIITISEDMWNDSDNYLLNPINWDVRAYIY